VADFPFLPYLHAVQDGLVPFPVMLLAPTLGGKEDAFGEHEEEGPVCRGVWVEGDGFKGLCNQEGPLVLDWFGCIAVGVDVGLEDVVNGGKVARQIGSRSWIGVRLGLMVIVVVSGVLGGEIEGRF
jgi:hypothetical protein